MRLVSLIIRIVAVSAFCLPVFAQQAAPGMPLSYLNEDIGVKAGFQEGWTIATSREEAPELIKQNFPENKGNNDSPLFIGIFQDGQLYSRLLVETFYADLPTYMGLLSTLLERQGLKLLSARITPENDAVELEYLQDPLKFRFRERISIVQGKYVLRMAFWSHETLYEKHLDTMNSIFDKVEFLRTSNDERVWETTWSGLADRLPVENMEGVTIASLEMEETAPLTCDDPDATLMWKITGNKSTVNIFGSIHVGKPEFYPLPAPIENAYRDAEFVVFEVDPQSLAGAAARTQLQAMGLLEEGRTLNEFVSQQVINDLVLVLTGLGLPSSSFMNLQPWFISMMLNNLQMATLGYLPEHGIETYLFRQKPEQSEILELESLMEQLEFLKQLNGETFLAYTLMEFEGNKERIRELIGAWRCADQEALEGLLFGDLESAAVEDPEMHRLMEMLFFERNLDMAEGIKEFLQTGEGDYFVVVGAGHLIGERSVIDYLDDEYEIVEVRK